MFESRVLLLACAGALWSIAAPAPEELDQLRRFQSVDISALAIKLLPRAWSASLRVSGGLAGDFEAIDWGLFRVNAMMLITHGFSERFALGGGALAGYAFGSFLPLPSTAASSRATRRTRASAIRSNACPMRG